MKFHKLKILLEKNIYYDIPEDKIELLYDFYTITWLKHLADTAYKNPKFKGFNDSSIELSLNEAALTVVNKLHEIMKEDYFTAISKEYYTTLGELEYEAKNEAEFESDDEGSAGDILMRLYNKLSSDSRTIYKKSTSAKLNIMKNGFKEIDDTIYKYVPDVDFPYGGDPWINAINALNRLRTADTYDSKVIAIDHAYDIAHNTGTILDKVGYNSGKLLSALDHKAAVKSVGDLIQYTSNTAKILSQYVSKELNLDTYEDYQKSDDKVNKLTPQQIKTTETFKYHSNESDIDLHRILEFPKWIQKIYGRAYVNIDNEVADVKFSDDQTYITLEYQLNGKWIIRIGRIEQIYMARSPVEITPEEIDLSINSIIKKMNRKKQNNKN